MTELSGTDSPNHDSETARRWIVFSERNFQVSSILLRSKRALKAHLFIVNTSSSICIFFFIVLVLNKPRALYDTRL